jgi:hypothetical protein
VQLYRYFVSKSSQFCRHNTLCCFWTSNTKGKRIFRYRLSPETFEYTLVQCKSRDSSVGIVLAYGLDGRGSRVRFPAGAENCSLHHRVQNGSGAHPASYPMGTRGSFPGGKAARAWSWPLTSIYCRGQRMSGTILLLPQYAFMAWCWLKNTGTTLPLPRTLWFSKQC